MTAPSALVASDTVGRARAYIETARLVLCDVDGCLVESEAPCPGAIGFVERIGERLRLVTNNSTDVAATLSARLAAMGFQVPAERCFLAGELAVTHTAETYPGARVLVAATRSIREKVQATSLRMSDATPDVVLLCNDPAFDAAQLQRIATAAYRGVPVVAANLDRWRPDRAGRPLIETGSLIAALRAAVPGANISIVGKPDPGIFRAALGGVAPGDAVMIGDNRETDLVGAEALGLYAIQIGRGRRAIAPNLGRLM